VGDELLGEPLHWLINSGLPKRIYEFYWLAENDYTAMVSQHAPVNIVVSI
jgi:hypothetical protein